MAIRTPPAKPSPVTVAMQKEAERQGLTAYALSRSTGIAVNTIRRILQGEGSPTLATTEAVAKALGMVVKVERK